MFGAVLCSFSGGHIVLLQHLVSSFSVNGRIVRQLRADWLRYSYTILFWCSYIDILVLLVLHFPQLA
jgi:hypothetical protein